MSAPELERESEEPLNLPRWFINACSPEMTPNEAERWLAWWRTLDPTAKLQAEEEKGWTLPDWLHWFTPEERQWYWWDAAVADDRSATVTVTVSSWPAPIGALRWLLQAAGATSVVVDGEPV